MIGLLGRFVIVAAVTDLFISDVSGAPESKCTRNVGSSFWKRPSDLEKFVSSARFLGCTASERTASGTYIDVIDRRRVPSVKVAPERDEGCQD